MKLTIGLFGFGVVGEGIYNVLQQTPSLNATVKLICIKDPSKKRNIDKKFFTTSAADILNDPEINVVVELINDPSEAFTIVTTALRKKKAVVSANKKMIAEHLKELLNLQESNQVPLLYEAAVCGSIPVIRNLEEYYDNDLLEGICGIVNGSTNYILTKVSEGSSYKESLLQAQANGFAETDPTLDVRGFDAVNKLTILLLHSYGILTLPNKLLAIGIDRIHSYDATFAASKGFQIKLAAQAKKFPDGKVASFVLPQFVTSDSQLFGVRNEYNGMVLQSSFADKQFLYGKGAGRYPTASAVLSDISALRYDYKYEYRKYSRSAGATLASNFYLNIYASFNAITDIDLKDFEMIEEFRTHTDRSFLTGIISYHKLVRSKWIGSSSVSIIVCPDGVIESIGELQIRKKSLELAGVKFKEPVMEGINLLKDD